MCGTLCQTLGACLVCGRRGGASRGAGQRPGQDAAARGLWGTRQNATGASEFSLQSSVHTHNSVSEKCVAVLSVLPSQRPGAPQRSRVTSEVRGQGCPSAYGFPQVLQRRTTSRFQAMWVPAARRSGVLFQDNRARGLLEVLQVMRLSASSEDPLSMPSPVPFSWPSREHGFIREPF